MLIFNFGEYYFWDEFPAKVTFDGVNKLILVNDGETELDFRNDVYSAWKEWKQEPNQENGKYLEAVSVVGGDPLPGNRVLGSTFFLENGWRMRTWEGDHILTITGNVFTREGDDPFVDTITDVKVTINLNTSTLVETIELGAELGIDSVLLLDEIHKVHGLNVTAPLIVSPTSRTAGDGISQTIAETVSETTVTRDS